MSTTTSNAAVRRIVFSSTTCEWPTPQALFDELDDEFHFVLDACASRTNRKANTWYGLDHPSRARRDGLAGNWAADVRSVDRDGAVWMNPPYGKGIAAWMAKAQATAAAGVTVVCLVPARTDTKWFHEHVLGARAQVRFLRGRVKFGDAKNSAPFPNLVIVYRPNTVALAAAA